MQLLLSGNPNLKTIKSVIFFTNKHYSSKINKIHFIDSNDTLYDRAGKSIESERNDMVRNIIPFVKIESTFIEESHIHTEIPKLISEQLNIYSKDNIVVDLTNGKKYISSVLYAAASLSQINKLFFLFIKPSKFETNLEDLKEEDYEIENISTLENIDAIGKYIFFDIIYYRNKEEYILEEFNGVEFNSRVLNNVFTSQQINNVIFHYFTNNYADAINGMGQIMEEFSLELCYYIKNSAKGQIKTKLPNTFDSAITWIRTEFCDKLRGKRNIALLPYEEKMKELQTIDKILDTIKVYRNISSHPYDFLRGREEAKFIINNAFYVLDLFIRSGIFK